ncbi:MAG: methylenetetrahydrofolate--tRNA-(uracil(54)-C(5))-methyltransferase (FADH(2)-oxidizing) TrmFO [Oscillospiraceae bacterium]|jgi:methylenetetrahydrofolate--tRNA-(uracil-5-)-methyltransferase|nr:methylenetetrahydrofolate--tRNA-(uracil(54)-C(5))-methyltransferase (FADH(2)-oxidizing) TrmFO [Oscillospiraceae bacterium]
MPKVKVIGAGLAGSEAAWQLACRGIEVELCDMKPESMSPAHHSGNFGELVCSNSLRGAGLENAPGLLKEELRRLGSLVMYAADRHRVAAGGALAVDRELFSREITEKLTSHSGITFTGGEVSAIPDSGDVIVATGPLTSGALAQDIIRFFGGEDTLSFYDAAAPIVDAATIDMNSAFFASRYNKGTADYINCPMTEDEYRIFWEALKDAKEAAVHGFEDKKVFEGCMPVEVMARRGYETLRYGPLKPVGLSDPRSSQPPFAVVQLRKDNREGTLYNLVGFQTHLTFGEQKRVFSMIPALRNADFVRYGVMHRNTYLNSPKLLGGFYEAKICPRVSFAGQMTGVEGYIESAASGLYAAAAMAGRLLGVAPFKLGSDTATGALAAYISGGAAGDFQPMNINFGIMTPLSIGAGKLKKRDKNLKISERALEALDKAILRAGLDIPQN